MTCGRPRAHGLVERIPHTHRHIVTDTGLHHALLFTHAHDNRLGRAPPELLP